MCAFGGLVGRYREWVGRLPRQTRDAWLFPQSDDPSKPMWNSAVRKELHGAAEAKGLRFPGSGRTRSDEDAGAFVFSYGFCSMVAELLLYGRRYAHPGNRHAQLLGGEANCESSSRTGMVSLGR
jgi:hypothetical protein